MKPEDCCVVVPYRDHIEPACEEALRGLEDRGYPVCRQSEPASVDLKRSHMATDALADGFEEILWIDSDTVFEPDEVEKLRAHGLPLVGGIYAKRVRPEFACVFLKDTATVTIGEGGGLLEVRYVGTGFLLTRRQVYEDIQRKFSLPVCNNKWPTPVVPYFQPLVAQESRARLAVPEPRLLLLRACTTGRPQGDARHEPATLARRQLLLRLGGRGRPRRADAQRAPPHQARLRAAPRTCEQVSCAAMMNGHEVLHEPVARGCRLRGARVWRQPVLRGRQ